MLSNAEAHSCGEKRASEARQRDRPIDTFGAVPRREDAGTPDFGAATCRKTNRDDGQCAQPDRTKGVKRVHCHPPLDTALTCIYM